MCRTHHSLQDNLKSTVRFMFTVPNVFGAWHHLTWVSFLCWWCSFAFLVTVSKSSSLAENNLYFLATDQSRPQDPPVVVSAFAPLVADIMEQIIRCKPQIWCCLLSDCHPSILDSDNGHVILVCIPYTPPIWHHLCHLLVMWLYCGPFTNQRERPTTATSAITAALRRDFNQAENKSQLDYQIM